MDILGCDLPQLKLEIVSISDYEDIVMKLIEDWIL